jgi:hypothetical protein
MSERRALGQWMQESGRCITSQRVEAKDVSYPKDELTPPAAAAEDPKSFEIARLWMADDAQHVVLRTELWPDPAAWGIVLADLARHVAVSYQRSSGYGAGEALERVLTGLRAGLEAPGEEPPAGA